MFAFEACAISRERLVATDVFRRFGWDVEESRRKVLDGFVMSTFRNLLFQEWYPTSGESVCSLMRCVLDLRAGYS